MEIKTYKAPFGDGVFYELVEGFTLGDCTEPEWQEPELMQGYAEGDQAKVVVTGTMAVRHKVVQSLPARLQRHPESRLTFFLGLGCEHWWSLVVSASHCMEVSMVGGRKDRHTLIAKDMVAASNSVNSYVQGHGARMLLAKLEDVNDVLRDIVEELNKDGFAILMDLLVGGGPVSKRLDKMLVGQDLRGEILLAETAILNLQSELRALEHQLQAQRKAFLLQCLAAGSSDPRGTLAPPMPASVRDDLLKELSPDGRAFEVKRLLG